MRRTMSSRRRAVSASSYRSSSFNGTSPISDSLAALAAERFAEMAPHIDDSKFSDPDRQHTQTLWLLLNSLNSFIDAFRADVELFDHAEADATVMMRWAPIACRDAAMTLRNFKSAIDTIEKTYRQCAPLRSRPRGYALRGAVGLFGAEFPDATDARNVTAHPVGQMDTAAARRRNSLRGTSVMVLNSWAGRRVLSTHNGREVSFEISEQTIETLKKVRNAVFNAFRDQIAEVQSGGVPPAAG
jgi:hypothetical protein